MDLWKLLNKDLKKPENGLKQVLILGALAVIVMGFGNGFSFVRSPYDEQYSLEPDHEMGRHNAAEEHKKRRHKHHHRNRPDDAHTNTATVEDAAVEDAAVEENDTSTDDTLNPPYAPYTVE